MMVPGPVISTTSYSSDWKDLPVENWILVQVQNNPEVLRDLIGRRNKYFEDPTQRIQIMILYHRKFSKVRFGVLKISDPDHGVCTPRETYAGTCACANGWAGARCNAHDENAAHTHASPSATSKLSCGSIDEFESTMAPVTVECCDEPTEDCSTGIPSSCNAGCAALLLPAQAACEDFLIGGGIAMAGTKAIVDRAAAQCPQGGAH
eukprot:SAG31_NODE_5924_length_2255_cov_3.889610_1_plen_206_part_00